MKKILYTFLTFVSVAQFSYGALPALEESLAEYQAIVTALTSNPSFDTVIPANESIIDIKRLTRRVNVTGTVRYKIITRVVDSDDSSADVSACCGRRHHRNTNTYIAVLSITANPALGPFVITVQSITEVSRHSHTIINAEEQEFLLQEEFVQ